MLGSKLLEKAINNSDKYQTVLDIGSGSGIHSKQFLDIGKNVTSLDYGTSYEFEKNGLNSVIKGDYNLIKFEHQFDLIWCCHVLEHQRNVGVFLEKLYTDLKEDGILCLTVPPYKPNIVGGHVSLWNMGLLIYNLVLSGFDCSELQGLKYDYNISIYLTKKSIKSFPKLANDRNDFDLLKEFLPSCIVQNVDGDFDNLNWEKL